MGLSLLRENGERRTSCPKRRKPGPKAGNQIMADSLQGRQSIFASSALFDIVNGAVHPVSILL